MIIAPRRSNSARTSQPPEGVGPATTSPPYSATRSLMPASPCPASPADSGGHAPAGGPLSLTWTQERRPAADTVTSTRLSGPACLRELVSAS